MNKLLGRDLQFPIRPDNTGDLATVSDQTNLYQSLVLLAEVAQGELLYSESVGTGLWEHIHKTLSERQAIKLAFLVQDQIMKYEG